MLRDEQVSNKILETSKIATVSPCSSSVKGDFCSLPIGMRRVKMASSFSSKRLSRSVQWKRSVLSSTIGQFSINSFNFVVNNVSLSWFNKLFIHSVTLSLGGRVFRVGCRVILAILKGTSGTTKTGWDGK